jgi:hypothetical protein
VRADTRPARPRSATPWRPLWWLSQPMWPEWAQAFDQFRVARYKLLGRLPYLVPQVLRGAAVNAPVWSVEVREPSCIDRHIGQSPSVQHERTTLAEGGSLLAVKPEQATRLCDAVRPRPAAGISGDNRTRRSRGRVVNDQRVSNMPGAWPGGVLTLGERTPDEVPRTIGGRGQPCRARRRTAADNRQRAS